MTEPELLARHKVAVHAFLNAEATRSQSQVNAERERNQKISETNTEFDRVSQDSNELLQQVEAEYAATQGVLNRVQLGHLLTSAMTTISLSDFSRDPRAELTSALNQARNIKVHLQARANELEQVRLFHSKLVRVAVGIIIIAGLVVAMPIAGFVIYLFIRR